MKDSALNTFQRIKIPFTIKFWSLWFYFRPIFWEGTYTKKKWFIAGIYNDVEDNFSYLERLMNMGQLVSLHDIGIKKITEDIFFNPEYFPQLVYGSFWTMSDLMISSLSEKIKKIPQTLLLAYSKILAENDRAYKMENQLNPSSDFVQATYKLSVLNSQHNKAFSVIISKDAANRKRLLDIFSEAILENIQSINSENRTTIPLKINEPFISDGGIQDQFQSKNCTKETEVNSKYTDESLVAKLEKIRIWHEKEDMRTFLWPSLITAKQFPKDAHLQIICLLDLHFMPKSDDLISVLISFYDTWHIKHSNRNKLKTYVRKYQSGVDNNFDNQEKTKLKRLYKEIKNI